ncbi:MAG: hypothetical protein VKJ24_09455 [Synechococcales bacterium]|nr:hypothetical protein [Synechococcales bacterium]
MMTVETLDVEQLAIEFLMTDLGIPEDEQDFFAVLNSRSTDGEWAVVELGIEGLPDKWVLQVFSTGECDPCYTFISPIAAAHADTGLDEFPPTIAEIVLQERRGERLS